MHGDRNDRGGRPPQRGTGGGGRSLAARGLALAVLATLTAAAPSTGTPPPATPPGGTGSAAAAPPLAGTYRVQATARVRASPVIERDVEQEVLVTLSRGAKADAVRVRLESEGHACELGAQLTRGDTLTFAPGQKCSDDVDEPDARGHAEATLQSGRGRVRDGTLELDLAWDLSGTMSVRVLGREIEVFGRKVEVPPTWTPDVPLRGTVVASGEGPRHEPVSTGTERPARRSGP